MPIVNKISLIPLLIIHGDKDNVVPLLQGEYLFTAAVQPKEMWLVPGGGHIKARRHKKYQTKLLENLLNVLTKN